MRKLSLPVPFVRNDHKHGILSNKILGYNSATDWQVCIASKPSGKKLSPSLLLDMISDKEFFPSLQLCLH